MKLALLLKFEKKEVIGKSWLMASEVRTSVGREWERKQRAKPNRCRRLVLVVATSGLYRRPA